MPPELLQNKKNMRSTYDKYNPNYSLTLIFRQLEGLSLVIRILTVLSETDKLVM